MKKVNACVSTALLLSCAFVVSGCGTFPMRKENRPGGIECAILRAYPGSNVPTNQIATICTAEADNAFVSEVDDRVVRLPPWPISKDGWEEMRFEVLPGMHTLKVNTEGAQNLRLQSVLTFTAEAGHVYHVKSDAKSLAPSLTDVTSGTPVTIPTPSGRSGFESAVQKAMSNGSISSDAITVTYPDGATKTITAPGK